MSSGGVDALQRTTKRLTKQRAEQLTSTRLSAALDRETEERAARPIRGPPSEPTNATHGPAWNRVPPAILRIGAVQQRTGLSRSAIYRLMADDPTFPLPVRLSPRSIGWPADAVDTWLAQRPLARRARLNRQADL